MNCLQDLTSATTEEEFRFHSLPRSPIPAAQLSPSLPTADLQRQISHFIAENNRFLSRYHTILQEQKQKSVQLQNEISEKETQLANVKANLESYNEQLRRNAQELLQVCRFIEEKKEMKVFFVLFKG